MSHSVAAPILDVDKIRRDFPILAKPLDSDVPLVYLDNAATSQKPRQVIQKITECYENDYSNVHRGIHRLGDRITVELEESREKVRRFIGARDPEEVIFTSGTTMSINLVASAWGRKFLEPGDEIVLNVMEHHANLVPWQQVAKSTQARLKYAPLTSDGRLDLDAFREQFTPRTKLVAVTGMSNVLGTINPISEIVAIAKQHGALVLVDAAQSVPHHSVNVCDPQIDFLAFSGHKIYGPSGVGVLYARRPLLEAMDPFLFGGNMISEVHLESSEWADLPAKFEAGTLPIVQAVGLGAAIDYVESIGLPAIAAHERQLLQYAQTRLSEISGLRIYGPDTPHKGAIISFTVEGLHPHDLAALVDQKGVAVRAGHHCTMPLHDSLNVSATSRASFAVYNTMAEVDVLVDAVQSARKKFRLK